MREIDDIERSAKAAKAAAERLRNSPSTFEHVAEGEEEDQAEVDGFFDNADRDLLDLCAEVRRLRELVQRGAAMLEMNTDKEARHEWAKVLRAELGDCA